MARSVDDGPAPPEPPILDRKEPRLAARRRVFRCRICKIEATPAFGSRSRRARDDEMTWTVGAATSFEPPIL
jgi:hypothetical protein